MQYIQDIKHILAQARQKSYQAINTAMVEAYWNIGKTIVIEEQNGKQRADYGKAIIKTISSELTTEFGKGFSERNVHYFRKFYITFPEFEILQTLSAKLSWSHYQLIMGVASADAQRYYLEEASNNMWSVRTLDRNISTLYYQRLLSSQVKIPVVNEMQENTKALQQDTFEFIKNPTV
ncbi:MAG: DUF1016 N-terminal domain-containing protein, partial [Bacteroidia bacterium]